LWCFNGILIKKKEEEENQFFIWKEKKSLEVARKTNLHTKNKLCTSLDLRNSTPIKKRNQNQKSWSILEKKFEIFDLVWTRV